MQKATTTGQKATLSPCIVPENAPTSHDASLIAHVSRHDFVPRHISLLETSFSGVQSPC